jgi:hypothetical protein
MPRVDPALQRLLDRALDIVIPVHQVPSLPLCGGIKRTRKEDVGYRLTAVVFAPRSPSATSGLR